ncbi:MAG: ankyrin repeat domain-containing protein, partial [Gammaproteobacteria bacterium]|nr:ankyrin repeat domain-containing protein [Gammaproteobacteria bacterium]
LDQLKQQAKDLLRDIRRGDPSALAELQQHHPRPVEPNAAKLADIQLALARSYGLSSWSRLVIACRLIAAISQDDAESVRDLVLKHPRLLHENAGGVDSNWGPPMSYAANLGRNRIVAMLSDLGAQDLQFAFDRACLQGRLDTARQLHAMGARPAVDCTMGPAETQSGSGLAFLLELGATISDEHGERLAPVAMVLQTYSRNPQGKHQCLELFAEHGIDLPDTPPMAVHRGRIDLLDAHLGRDPDLLGRTFSHEEIYPPELRCHADHSLALHGTPLAGGTLLHLCVDYDEIEIARWLLERGAHADAPAAVDGDGFGGHTALFACVVSQPYRTSLRKDDAFARLLLDHGADPNARASLRKELRFVEDESMHEYVGVTPLAWGQRFHDQTWVSKTVMQLITERGGKA